LAVIASGFSVIPQLQKVQGEYSMQKNKIMEQKFSTLVELLQYRAKFQSDKTAPCQTLPQIKKSPQSFFLPNPL
jgi:hypothetical protein